MVKTPEKLCPNTFPNPCDSNYCDIASILPLFTFCPMFNIGIDMAASPYLVCRALGTKRQPRVYPKPPYRGFSGKRGVAALH